MLAFSRISPSFSATIMLVLVPSLAGAQEGLKEVSGPVPAHTGVYGGVNFSVGVPMGEFDENVDVSPGIAGMW